MPWQTLARTGLLACLAAIALTVDSPGSDRVAAHALNSTGAVQHANSADGQAVLSASNMRPGDSTAGTVTISNGGGSAGAFALEQGAVSDTPGPGGGRLSTALRLSVRDEGSSQVVYSGPLDGLATRALGTWAAGEERTYRFDVALPAEAADQNSLQAARARVEFRWRAQAADAPPPDGGGGDVTPPPTGDGGGYVPPAPGGGATAVPPPPPADTKPPRLTLRAPKKQKLRRRTVRLVAVCDEDCRIVATSLRGARWKAPKLLKAGARTRVTIKLSKRDAKKLVKRRRPVIKLKLTAADVAGNRAKAKVKIPLKR